MPDDGSRAALAHYAIQDTRPAEHADPYAIDATKCAKCGSGEFHVQVLAWATFQGGTFVDFDYSKEVLPIRTIAICADCHAERVIEP